MPNWEPVAGSTRVIAVAYDAVGEVIYVRFDDDVEWQYEGCPPQIWEAFTAPGQSKGRYIAGVLDHHRHGRFAG